MNDWLRESDDLGYRALSDLQQGQLELAWSRRALARGDHDSAERFRDLALERIRNAESPRHDGDRAIQLPLTQCSAEARMIRRLLHAQLSKSGKARVQLSVAIDGSAFRLEGRPEVTFPRSPVLRRVLLALAEHRTKAPGRALPTAVLLEQGWPGERVLSEPGARRVRECVRRLRRAGLREILLTSGEGYLLDPAVPLVRGLGTTNVAAS